MPVGPSAGGRGIDICTFNDMDIFKHLYIMLASIVATQEVCQVDRVEHIVPTLYECALASILHLAGIMPSLASWRLNLARFLQWGVG